MQKRLAYPLHSNWPNNSIALDLVQNGYQQSQFGHLQLLTAQRTYARVSLAYLQARRELWLNSVQVDGLLLIGSIGVSGP